MSYQPYIVALLLFATINGIFSPYVILVFPFVFVLTPAFFIESVGFVFYFTSLIISTGTLILAGVPAALYERWTGAKESTEMSMWLWLAGTAVLSIPAAVNFFQTRF